MADAITGDTELGSNKAAMIAAVVQKELAFKAKLARTVTDVSMFAVKGAKSISFPKLTSFTVIDRVEGVAGDATALTASNDTMLLDQNAYVAWILDAMTKKQITINGELEFAKRAASAHARYLDSKIIAEAEIVGVPVAAAGALSRDKILEMQEGILGRHGDLDKTSLWISPAERTLMLKIAEFTQAQIYGSSTIPSGVIGEVYGTEVIVHSGLASGQFFMVEKDGLSYGFQSGPQQDSQKANEYGVGATREAMDQLFGVKGLSLGEQGVLGTESALIMKDAN